MLADRKPVGQFLETAGDCQPGGTRLFHNADGAFLMIDTLSSSGANTISTGVFSHVEGPIR